MPSKINTFAVMLNKLNTFEVMLNKINSYFLLFLRVPNKINTYAKQDQHFAVMLNKINTAMPSKINTFAVMLNKINTFEVMLNKINTHFFAFFRVPNKINARDSLMKFKTLNHGLHVSKS